MTLLSYSKRWVSSAISSNPFLILGISRTSDYATVKAAFLKAAMKHHPDQASGSGDDFLRVRAAFEQIVATLKSEQEGGGASTTRIYRSEQEFRTWFRKETEQFLSFEMSDATVKEVVNVYKTMASAGKDKGGYWEMARLVAERQANHARTTTDRNHKNTNPIVQISDGDTIVQQTCTMRRKRKR